jgi:hypothetical protein
MNATKKGWVIAGLVLHAVIGAIMILAGSAKVLGLMPPEELAKHGLGAQILLIGAGELLAAILLLVPRTSSLGVLLASSFWGGAICIHMAHAEPYLLQAALLALTWAGAYLRSPETFSSFSAPRVAARPVAETSDLVLS